MSELETNTISLLILPIDLLIKVSDNILETNGFLIYRHSCKLLYNILLSLKLYTNNTCTHSIDMRYGRREGQFIVYDNESISSIKTYRNNKLYGKCQYMVNGLPFVIIHYKNNMRHGKKIEYTIEDQVKYIENYYNGDLHGRQYTYFDNGKIESKYNFVNGKLHGLQTLYWRNGIKKTSKYYKNGILNGKEYNFSNSGELLCILNYNQVGLAHGINQFFYSTDTIAKTLHYRNGMLNGECFVFWFNGNIKKRYNYINGVLSGLMIEYDIYEAIICLRYYKYGFLHGYQMEMENNRLIRIECYELGDLVSSKNY